jgi:hypothetical protein
MRNVASRHRRVRRANRRALDDDGFSMIATALSLVATALLTAILLGTMLNSGGSSNGNLSGAPGIAQATALQAQQTLSTGLTTADTVAANVGGYGSIQPSTLTASNPSITFVTGPSTNFTTVSMAVVNSSVSQGASGGGGVGGYAGSIAAATGAASATGGAGQTGTAGTGQDGSAGSGAITLADRATNGTCWLIWKSAGGSAWYGAQTRQASCTAPAIDSAPSPGPVSSSTIGWQEGSFPLA